MQTCYNIVASIDFTFVLQVSVQIAFICKILNGSRDRLFSEKGHVRWLSKLECESAVRYKIVIGCKKFDESQLGLRCRL